MPSGSQSSSPSPVTTSRVSAMSKVNLACGVVAGPLFVVAFLIEGAVRDDYDPLRHAVSSLSIGDSGWFQIANFLITGSLILTFSLGLRTDLGAAPRSVWGPFLIGLAGMGLIGAGICVSDPVFGYPSALPLKVAQFTVHGHLHDLFSMFLFAGLPAASFVFASRFAARREHILAMYSRIAGVAMIITFILAATGFNQTPGFVRIAGLFQRVSIAIGMTWLSSLAIHQLNALALETPPISRVRRIVENR
jgi:hypothetical protein